MKKLTFTLICLLFAIPCQARTITVDANGSGDYPTIQAAIDDSNHGDTIILTPGTYTGNGNRDIDFLGKAITLRSTDPNDPNIIASTIIDCQGTKIEPHGGFYFHTGEDANSILDGLTITNGYASYTSSRWPENNGGGILCKHAGPTITNCAIIDNSAKGSGGGICCRHSSPIVTNCTISENSAEFKGGGVYYGYYSSPTISNCTISGNSAGSGGGIYCNAKNSAITGCTITGNSAKRERGGGIATIGGNLTIISCNISENHGRGIYSSMTELTIINCIVTQNNTATNGGGIYSSYENSEALKITQCTIVGNTAQNAGAIYGREAGWGPEPGRNPEITNCILWNNSSQQIVIGQGKVAIVAYSDIQGGWKGEGNIDIDPGFALDTDYHLMSDSPCIDAGTNTPTGGLPTTDIDGNTRPLDGNGDTNAVADMGAYEYNPQSPSIALSTSAVSFSCVQDGPEPATQTLLIRNCGGGTLNWEITEDCNWLYVTPTSGTSTGNIDEVALMVNHNSLTPGYYSCILKVREPNAVNSPKIVPVALHVFGEVVYVPSQASTIQHAIDYVLEGGAVIVADGTYTGHGNRDIDFEGRAITVKSENGPENCIIDCKYKGRGFYFHNNEDTNSVLDGFTITNGYTHDFSFPVGGAILCEQASPTITNCIITGNSSQGFLASGGGIACFGQGSPIITNCTISENSAEFNGGAICCMDSSPTVTNCIITGNSAGDEGGGVCCWDSSPTITNCTITDNSARDSGGGIFCLDGSPVITNCILWDNHATDGPEVYIVGFFYNAWINYTSVRDGESSVYVSPECTLNWGPGNIDTDPCFVEPGYWADANDPNIIVEPNDPNAVWIEGDYHLYPFSLCINTGDPNYIPEPNETDLDGNPRIIAGRIDMGAYESNHIKARLWILPQTINRQSRQRRIMTWLRLPQGITRDQIDSNVPLLLYPGQIEPTRQYIFQRGRRHRKRTSIIAFFDKSDLMAAVPNGPVELWAVGQLKTGRYFHGSDTVRIISRPRRPRRHRP